LCAPWGEMPIGLCLAASATCPGCCSQSGLPRAEPVHRVPLGTVAVHVREGPLGVAVLERVDPGLLAPPQQFQDPLGGVPGGQVLAEELVEVRVAVDGIATDDQPGDLVRPPARGETD
jgi:hypothetical protein